MEDRISDLPDHLIHHILSFMDAKYAVESSVLSKRWKGLWTSLPRLNFHSKYFHRGRGNGAVYRRFLKAFFSHHNNPFKIFTLTFVDTTQVALPISDIINFCASHNVETLNLCFTYPSPLPLPRSIYKFESLTTLRFHKIHFHAALKFPQLTTLHLEHCCGVGHLLTECANLMNLKDVVLLSCHHPDHVNIVSPSLSNLSILISPSPIANLSLLSDINGDGDVAEYFHPVCEIAISAPNLVSFNYKGWLRSSDLYPQVSSLYDLPSLERVSLDVCLIAHDSSSRHILKLLSLLHNAKFVTLSSDTIKLLSSIPFDRLKHQRFPLFNSLKELQAPGISSLPEHVKRYLMPPFLIKSSCTCHCHNFERYMQPP